MVYKGPPCKGPKLPAAVIDVEANEPGELYLVYWDVLGIEDQWLVTGEFNLLIDWIS